MQSASNVYSFNLLAARPCFRVADQPLASCSDRCVSQSSSCRPLDSSRNLGTALFASSTSRNQFQSPFVCSATKQERRRQSPAPPEGAAEKEEQTGFLASGAALVNTLLFGAASRIERGTSVCVSCRGTGTMVCKECDATGIVKSKKSSARDSGGRMRTLMGTKSKEKEFIVSNRCRVCRGHGRMECPHCDGIGKRNVVQRDMWM